MKLSSNGYVAEIESGSTRGSQLPLSAHEIVDWLQFPSSPPSRDCSHFS